MKHAIIVGDSCSGKSTVLQLLSQKGFRVVFENGLAKIPAETENDKSLSNKWFMDYYHQREKDVAVPTLFEYSLHFQYPFTITQRRTRKITPGQEVMLISYLASLTHKEHLDPQTIVFHFILDNPIIISRLAQKKLFKPASHAVYLDTLREETQRYFSSRSKYYQIDTTGKSAEEIAQWVEGILKKEEFVKS